MRAAELRTRQRRRIAVARALLLVAFAGLAVRAAHLSVFDERGGALGERQLGSVITLAPERGAIFDRSGHELALSVEAPSVYAVPAALEDPARTARALGRALDRQPDEIAQRLRGRRSFVFLARWVAEEQAARVRALGLQGVGIVAEPRRIYPYKELASQLVGFANIDGRGVRGIEQSEDDWLRGTPRRVPVERDGSGDLLVGSGDEAWSTTGGEVALTLDATMQSDALLALREAVEETGARSGLVISLDPTTGDVLALAEAPGFDPNLFRKLHYPDTRARSFLDAMEPGSTLKAFVVAAALERQVLGVDDQIDCEQGEFRVPGKTIRDLKPHGLLRSADILRVSSNIGAVKIAFRLGPEAHVSMLRRFGFGSVTGSGFPDESAGLLRDLPRSRPVDHATLAFGQGLAVTPMQLAAATAALANGGIWLRPRLVAARRVPGGRWHATLPERGRRAVSPETAAQVLGMLETVTGPKGTGRLAGLHGVRVAGKTGTAQKFEPEAGRYSERRFVAWFVGAVPADAPRLVVAVALDEPRRPRHTGGSAAAPLFARVAGAQLARLGILTRPEPAPRPVEPEPRWTTARRAPPRPAPEPRPAAAPRPAPARPAPEPAPRPAPELARLEDRVLLPDLRGLTVAEVKAVTSQTQLVVEISGRGRAVAQDPPAGTIVADRRTRIQVRFEPAGDAI